MTTIYRVEMVICPVTGSISRNNSIGPFNFARYNLARQNGFEHVEWLTNIDDQPEPDEDNLKNFFGQHFGFSSLQQFYNFFNCDIGRLVCAGFHLVEYELPEEHINYGNSQVSFPIYKAKIVNFHNIRDLVLRNHDELSSGYIKHLKKKKVEVE